ncbi:MAG: hypothetical protein LJE61_08425 [Thiocapsa sp.]|nr:hypothetical protein [Thiocapsa sp.]MCG6985207.1 hypothetical protein [Thiocapsa sp.]
MIRRRGAAVQSVLGDIEINNEAESPGDVRDGAPNDPAQGAGKHGEPDVQPDPSHGPGADLAAESPSLVRRFPLLARGTGVVLVDGLETDLHAYWRLASHDLAPAVAGFARDGLQPVLVLCLRRLQIGGPERVSRLPVRLSGLRGHGEQRFQIDHRPARYDAELGLSSDTGGWVLLARSNAIDHPARVGLRLGRGMGTPPRPEESGPIAGSDRDVSPQPLDSVATASSLPRPTRGAGREPVGVTGPSETHAAAGRDAVRAGKIESWPDVFAGGRADARPAEHPERDGTSPVQLVGPDDRRRGLVPSADPDAPAASASFDRQGSGGRIARLTYGEPVTRGTELMVEAELHVHGRAAPGCEIDLFGRPYRVGPGGRFQFVIRVEDDALIRRAFELNPPPLIDRSGDD